MDTKRMTVDYQIDMVKLIRKTNQGEAKVWRRQRATGTAYVCREYAKTCTAVLASLKRLKRIEGKERREKAG